MSTTVHTQPGAPCLSCHQPLCGPYCAACGQPSSIRARITLHDLLHDIPHSIWHVDHGVFYTLRELLVRPGATLHRYLAGERVRFFRPLALLLLLSGLASFIMAILNLDAIMTQATVESANAATTEAAEKLAKTNNLIYKYFSWFTILMLPVYAWLSWLLLRRLKLYYAEHLLVNAFLLSAVLLVQIGFMPLLMLTVGSPIFKAVSLAESLVLPLYQAWALYQFAGKAYVGGGRVVRALLIAFVGFALNSFLIYALAAFVVGLQK